MEVWYEQLEQINQDIAAQSAEVKVALEALLNNEDPFKRTTLQEAYDYAKEKETGLLNVKLALIARPPSPGEPTLLQHDVSRSNSVEETDV